MLLGTPIYKALRYDDPRVIAAGKALYIVMAPITQRTDEFGDIEVPVGTLTDFASIPDSLHVYIDKDDPWIAMPCIVHDYLYKVAGKLPDGRIVTREQADNLLREGMIICGARPTQARVVYWSVRLAGKWSWGKGHEKGIVV